MPLLTNRRDDARRTIPSEHFLSTPATTTSVGESLYIDIPDNRDPRVNKDDFLGDPESLVCGFMVYTCQYSIKEQNCSTKFKVGRIIQLLFIVSVIVGAITKLSLLDIPLIIKEFNPDGLKVYLPLK